MSQNENCLNAHECSHTNGRTHEVSEYQEGAAERNEAAMQGDTVENGAHSVLANAKVNIAAFSIQLGEEAFFFHNSFIGRTKVSAAAYECGQLCSQGLNNITACFTGCILCSILEQCLQSFEININLTSHAASQLCSQFRIYHLVIIHQSVPGSFACCAASLLSVEMLFNLGRNVEHFVRPASLFLRSCQRFTAQRLAMAGRAVLFRAAEADMRAHDNQRRMHRISLSFFNSSLHSINVFTVCYAQNLPAISLEASFNVFGEGDISGAFNGDFVIVIKVNQFA